MAERVRERVWHSTERTTAGHGPESGPGSDEDHGTPGDTLYDRLLSDGSFPGGLVLDRGAHIGSEQTAGTDGPALARATRRSPTWASGMAFRILLVLALVVAAVSALLPNQDSARGTVDPTSPDANPPAVLIQPSD